MRNNNWNKCKDIKNNEKTFKTSLQTSMVNKKNEMRKYKSNAPQLKQSNRPKNKYLNFDLDWQNENIFVQNQQIDSKSQESERKSHHG